MTAAEAADVRIDVSRIPAHVQRQLAAATITVMRRTQQEDPELWEKIEARAAVINEGRALEYGGQVTG